MKDWRGSSGWPFMLAAGAVFEWTYQTGSLQSPQCARGTGTAARSRTSAWCGSCSRCGLLESRAGIESCIAAMSTLRSLCAPAATALGEAGRDALLVLLCWHWAPFGADYCPLPAAAHASGARRSGARDAGGDGEARRGPRGMADRRKNDRQCQTGSTLRWGLGLPASRTLTLRHAARLVHSCSHSHAHTPTPSHMPTNSAIFLSPTPHRFPAFYHHRLHAFHRHPPLISYSPNTAMY